MQTQWGQPTGTESRKPQDMTVTTKDHFMQIPSVQSVTNQLQKLYQNQLNHLDIDKTGLQLIPEHQGFELQWYTDMQILFNSKNLINTKY